MKEMEPIDHMEPLKDDLKAPMAGQMNLAIALIENLRGDLDVLSTGEIRNKVKAIVHSAVNLYDFIR